MGGVLFRGLLSFLLPGALLFLAALLTLQRDLSQWLPLLSQALPYTVFGVALILGWRFEKSRLIFAALLFALAERALLHYATRPDFLGRIVFDAIAVLLPLNLALIAFYQERGLLTLRGLARLGLIVLQPLLVALLVYYERFDWLGLFDATVFGALPLETRLTQPALLTFGIALLVSAVHGLRSRGALEYGFFWALLTTLLTLVAAQPGPRTTLYLGMALLILVVAVVELSYRMAYRDELTGLPARRALNQLMLKLGGRYSIAMLDIDFFKKFNDRYGHDVGDQVLRMVAAQVGGVTGGGKPFRYGGEEFTVVFPGKRVEEVLPHLEKLRQRVQAAEFVIRDAKRPATKPPKKTRGPGANKRVAVTISIGVAERSERAASADEVISAADKALYRAKEAGRNCVAS